MRLPRRTFTKEFRPAAGVDWKSRGLPEGPRRNEGQSGIEHRADGEAGRVSRSGFDRFQKAEPSPDRDMDLRDAIQRIAVRWPSYGRPRITKELRRRGWRVNPKPVYRLMRDDNLLCVRRRKFVVTADSNH